MLNLWAISRGDDGGTTDKTKNKISNFDLYSK
jgi:hypothetical protein